MLSGIDLAILGAYVAWSAASGLASAKSAGTGLEEYALAGRSLSGWSAGISMAATQFAADTPLVVTGLVATSGLFALWRLWIYAIAFLLMGFVLGASWRRAGVVTDAELAELRYGGRPAAALRLIKAVHFGVAFNCTVLAMVLLATTRIVEPFGRWDLWLSPEVFAGARVAVEGLGLSLSAGSGACDAACSAECVRQTCFDGAAWTAATSNALSLGVVLVVTALYSTTGGLRAVVRTDLVQFVVAIVASVAYAVLVVQRVGGWDGLRERIGEVAAGSGDVSLLALTPFEAAEGALPLSLLAVLAVQWLAQINADGSGYLAQRTMACRSDRDARLAGVVMTVAQVLVRSLIWLPITLALILLFPADGAMEAGAREATYVRGIAEVMPPGLLGLMLAGMMGALASTLDTHLNWGASYLAHDVWARFVAPRALGRAARPRELVGVARISNVVLLVLALAIVPRLESIQTAWHVSLLLGAGLGVVLVLRWIWWRTTAMAELSAIVASMILAPVALVCVEDEPLRLLVVAGGATLMAILVARFGPGEDRARLRAFYERAHPPGFWGPIAAECAAESRARLGWGVLATASGSVAVFAALVGVATWMIGSEGPTWVGSRAVWIVGNLVVAACAAPLTAVAARRAAPRAHDSSSHGGA